MSTEKAASILRDFGETIGIPGLVFDDKGSCCLVFDANMLVNIGHDRRRDQLVLFSFLGELPRSSRSRQLAAMMEGNFFWQGTGGATLSLETGSRSGVLMLPVALPGLTAKMLHDVVEDFVNTTEEWIERLRRLADVDDKERVRPDNAQPALGLRV